MQTIYTTSTRLGRSCADVIDLNEYRRAMGLAEEAPVEEEVEVSPLLWARERQRAPMASLKPALGLGAWLLDICASAGVVAMTAAFTLMLF